MGRRTWFALLLLLVSACGGGGSETIDAAGEEIDAEPDVDAGDPIVSITIAPADPTIEIVDGVVTGQSFTASAVHQSGVEAPLTGTWSFDRADLGAIEASTGALTPVGTLGGLGTLSFDDGVGGNAQTSVTLRLRYTATIDPGLETALDGATVADPSMVWSYPYDGTVFPRGLEAPMMMWTGVGAGETYRIRVTGAYVSYEAVQTVPPPSRFSIDASDWDQITRSTDGDLAVSVQRHDGSTAYLPVTQTWTIAPGELGGVVYFNSVNLGKLVRMAPGDSTPEDFLTLPVGATCVGCHSVSANGERIVAALHGGYAPWTTFDAASGDPVFDSGVASGYEAISPDGAHVLTGQWSDSSIAGTGHMSLSTSDSTTELAQLTPGTGSPAHPAWAPSGTKIAFAVRTDGNGIDFTQATLWITDVDLATPTFGNTHEIVDNDVSRPMVSFPSFSPDSAWIAFERATQARAREGSSELWLTSADGATQIELDAANGGASVSYKPEFAPTASGGYLWVLFVSHRPYGNLLTDLNPATRRPQMWITAIDLSPTAGEDPSHPAFWLPGQDLTDSMYRTQWAVAP